MHKNSKRKFLEKLKEHEKNHHDFLLKWSHHNTFRGDFKTPDGLILIDNQTFKDKVFGDIVFEFIRFENCKFISCEFRETVFEGCYLINCRFENNILSEIKCFESEISECIFNRCLITYFHFGDSSLLKTKFIDCKEILELSISNSQCNDIHFINSNVVNGHFNRFLKTGRGKNFTFQSSILTSNYFSNLDLRRTSFQECEFNQNTFIKCILKTSTIDESNQSPWGASTSIDLLSLHISGPLLPSVLKGIFGITEPDIKTYTEGLIKEVSFQSVFISYSFQDREFAHKLNDALRFKGVITFLWEKDAPGGERLKKIMRDNILKHDRVLFVASKNSIKSEACQFELSEARKKQDLNWETVYYPVHIDNFLFEVTKDEIRPLEKQDEYWLNIRELRQINSLDFSLFNKSSIDLAKFDTVINKLHKSLKK